MTIYVCHLYGENPIAYQCEEDAMQWLIDTVYVELYEGTSYEDQYDYLDENEIIDIGAENDIWYTEVDFVPADNPQPTETPPPPVYEKPGFTFRKL